MSSNNKDRIIDRAWEKLFSKYNILEEIDKNDLFYIQASQINEFKEARLMTKFDYSKNLPALFSENELNILPVTRGEYVIGRFNTYEKFDKGVEVETTIMKLPNWVETIDPGSLTSEAAVLNCAYVSGMIADLMGTEHVLPTVSGRMSSGSFDFDIYNKMGDKRYSINVKNSQCEIDAGFEGPNDFYMIEAKNSISDDFLVRQLYYPWRLWNSKVKKKVTPVYLVYTESEFNFYIYEFEEGNEYNSLVLKRNKKYIIEQEKIHKKEVEEKIKEVIVLTEPEVPYPQANSIEKVREIIGMLDNGPMKVEDITMNYAFDSRQADYYSNACVYLGLVERKDGMVYLTEAGEEYISKTGKEKKLMLLEKILEHETFNYCFEQSWLRQELMTDKEMEQYILSCEMYNVQSEVTKKRRMSTVKSWVKWCMDLAIPPHE